MSKAVLVLDMPERCMDCPLEFGVNGQISANICRGYEKYMFNPDHSKKPDWCPLRELPKRKKVSKYMNEKEKGYCEGWNACIDAITGGEE